MISKGRKSEDNIDISYIREADIASYYLGVNLKQAESKFINYIIYGGIETKEFAFSIIENIKIPEEKIIDIIKSNGSKKNSIRRCYRNKNYSS